MARTGSLIADRQLVFCVVTRRAANNGQVSAAKVNGIEIRYCRCRRLIDNHGAVAFVIGQRVTVKVCDNRSVVHSANIHRRVVVGTRSAIAVRQQVANGSSSSRGVARIGVFISDRLDQSRHCRRVRVCVQRDHKIRSAATAGKRSNDSAFIRNITAAGTNLSRTSSLIDDRKYVFGAVAASFKRNR